MENWEPPADAEAEDSCDEGEQGRAQPVSSLHLSRNPLVKFAVALFQGRWNVCLAKMSRRLESVCTALDLSVEEARPVVVKIAMIKELYDKDFPIVVTAPKKANNIISHTISPPGCADVQQLKVTTDEGLTSEQEYNEEMQKFNQWVARDKADRQKFFISERVHFIVDPKEDAAALAAKCKRAPLMQERQDGKRKAYVLDCLLQKPLNFEKVAPTTTAITATTTTTTTTMTTITATTI